MRITKKWQVATAVSAAAALMVGLTACDPASEESGDGAILNVVRSGSAIQKVFNPYLPVTAFGQGGTNQGGMMIYEPLVMVNTIRAGDFKPWLASGWEWSEDGTGLHVDLREGIAWTDGEAFTSDDVVFSYETIQENPALNLRGIQFESIEADGDYAVDFTFAQQSIQTFDKVVQLEIVPEHIYGEQADLTTFADEDPVGTGPFLLGSFSNESFQIVANPDYWQEGKPAIGGLLYQTVADNNAVAQSLVQGEADWASSFIANVDEVFLSKSPDFKRFWPVVGSDGLITNNATYPFDEKEIREAVSMALERQQIADVAGRDAAKSPIGLPMPVFEDEIADKFKDVQYVYDRDAAVELLESIGFEQDSDGKLVRDGEPLAFTITIPQAFTEQVAAAQVIQAQLAEIGITVDVNGVAVEAIDGITTKGEFQATIGYPIATQILAYNLYDSWMNPKYALPVGEAILTKQNIQRTTSPELEGYFADYLAATSDEERDAAVEGLQTFFVEEFPWLVISYYQTYGAWSEAKATGWPTDEDPWWSANVNPVVAIELQPK